MQKPNLTLQIELDTPSLSVPYGERPPKNDADLVKAQEPDANGDDVVLRGRIIASSSDLADLATVTTATTATASNRAPAFEIKEAQVSFTTRTFLINPGLDNRSILDVYHQTITLFATDCSSADLARQKAQLGPMFNDLSSSLFTSISIPFKLCLPKWLPPTLVTTHAKVLHSVSAKIKYAYSQKSISAVILGRTPTTVQKSQRDVPVHSRAPLSVSSTATCSFTNAKTSKPRDFYWKVQVPRFTAVRSHLDLILKFTILPGVAREMINTENVSFDIVQEKTRVWDVHEQSSWSVIAGKRENSESFLIGAARRSEKFKEYLLTPLEVPFQPAPPPPPSPPSPPTSNRSQTLVSETEIYYALRICLSLRQASAALLPSCNTPFLKVGHKVRVAVQLSNLKSKQKEICTIMVPVIITNDGPTSLNTAIATPHTTPCSSPEPESWSEELPSYDDAVFESQTIHVVGPVTRWINSWSKEQSTKLPCMSEESLPDDLPYLQT
ncbi:uncharacterized protein V1513DRAFT_67414 [Lipomyces chichibuensis]|uniref:uncharacterized protein n=1 Tax=Lipomyces chichibuensis TaxID=1546026 RepID=UPI00334366B2